MSVPIAPLPAFSPRLAPHQVILRPLVTEKGMHRANRHNAYSFEVVKEANKADIRRAVEEMFNVRVEKVAVQNRIGKMRRSRVRKHKKGGRNNQGKITARHRGGGHMQHYRLIDFRRNKDGVPGNVHSIQYDPNRTCRVALLHYADGEKRFILAPEGLVVGATLMSGESSPPEVGNCLPMSAIPLGMQIHNIELQAGRGGRLCRSAGSSAVLVALGRLDGHAGWAFARTSAARR